VEFASGDRLIAGRRSSPAILDLGTIERFDGEIEDIFKLIADRRQAQEVLRFMMAHVDSELLEAEDIKRKVETRVSTTFDAKYLWQDFESLNELQRRLFSGFDVSIGAITAVSTVGYIFWSLRGGVLMAAALSQMPNWRLIDPLPVLESYEMRKASSGEDELKVFFDNK